MSVDLALRLLRSGVVPDGDVEGALLDSLQRGVAFPLAFAERGPVLAQLMERELARSAAPLIRTVRALPELMAVLPPGLCPHLLAVPVRRDARTGTIDVAAVDPLDAHVPAEFVFHLGAPVRVLRAPLAEVLAALEALPDMPIAPHIVPAPEPEGIEGGTPAFGMRAVRRDGPAHIDHGRTPAKPRSVPKFRPPPPTESRSAGSEPPIPLVRRPVAPGRWPRRKGTNPGVGSVPPPAIGVLEDEAGDPVIGLFRSKPPSGPDRPIGSASPLRSQDDFGLALMALAEAETPNAVAEQLVLGLGTVARSVLVLAVRGSGYDGRTGNVGSTTDIRALHVPAAEPSVLTTAAKGGHYLGPLPRTSVHDGIARLLGDTDEVYVVPVVVSGRPALMVVVAGFASSFEATRRADSLAGAAGEAVEQILLRRKQTPPG